MSGDDRARRETELARKYAPIDTWAEILRMAHAGTFLWYHAPLDLYPAAVNVVRVFKNGKIRVKPVSGDADPFTADEGHLNRFRRRRNPNEGTPARHLCRSCGRAYEMHAGPDNPDCPPERCPGAHEPTGAQLDRPDIDEIFKAFWNERSTVFAPVR